jgi:hypothetical protein
MNYTLGKDEKDRPTLTVPAYSLSFSVWRDLSRVCGKSQVLGQWEVFTCLVPDTLSRAESILQGACIAPARLDKEGTAKPLTRLIKHVNPDHCVGPYTHSNSLEYENERGERIPLKPK